ncbi:MAG: T9SS type A sorting domain-containing protein [Ginsengibacter sp.]
MKQFLLSACALIFSAAVFSQTNCPYQFSRTNNNATTCASHIRLYFTSCPAIIPTLDSVKIGGVLQPETFTMIEKICNGNSIYVDYCISDDNLPTAGRIKAFLTYRDPATSAITGASACEINPSGIAPVILSDFGIRRSAGNEVAVSWQTQQEISSDRFEIERAFDKTSFEKIGTVLAAGFSGSVKAYTFSDNANSSTNVSFYRIKMIDKDGAFIYSETKSVKASSVRSNLVLFPNPSHGSVKITLTDMVEPTVVQLLDASGRLMRSTILLDINTIQINNLQKGSYFVRIAGRISGNTEVRKLSVID